MPASLPTLRVAEHDVQVVEYRGERVVTFEQIDTVHGRPDGTAKRNFNDNRDRFVEGVDTVLIPAAQKDEFRPFGIDVPNRGLRMFTRRGYFKIVKCLQDDLAWQIHGEMVEAYFAFLDGPSPAAVASAGAIVVGLDEGACTRIGGIVKRNTGVVARDQILPGVREIVVEALAAVLPGMVQSHLEADVRAVAVGFKPALAVLEERKVPSRRRRAFSQKCSSRLRHFSAKHGHPMRISRETGRYLFHVDAIAEWLETEGNRMIREHVAAISGQGVLRLVPPKGSE